MIQTMSHKYLKKATSIVKDFVNECFDIINECCNTQRGGLLHYNRVEYVHMNVNKENEMVPYVYTHGKDIEMYSEDGWDSLEDLGHWTDVCVDIVRSLASGHADSYGYNTTEPHVLEKAL